MKTIRARFTILTAFAVIISVLAGIMIIYLSVANYFSDRSDDVLRLVCAERQEALDKYFNSIEQSVDTVANYAETDLSSSKDFEENISHTDKLFSTIAANTRGTLTYYYRIDPAIARDEIGFWYIKNNKSGEFVRSELTQINKFDPDDVSRVGWFFIPKNTGEPVWIEPYVNQNIDARMISYVVPVYRGGVFAGVVGMDFSYESLVANMEDIREFRTGYAFLTNRDGQIIYHKDLESGTQLEGLVPDELIESASDDDSGIIRYTYKGLPKRAASAELSNDMKLYVTVDDSEIHSELRHLIYVILFAALIITLIFIAITMLFSERITRPLRELTRAAAEFDSGNYDVEINYNQDDEIGILTRTFLQMSAHLKSHIGNLNTMAFRDPLTSIRNKTAFDAYAAELDRQITSAEEDTVPAFAVCMFDCNFLKEINDRYGHDKGDIYIKETCQLICDVFRHSAVFRTGGDEFVAVLQKADYDNREELCKVFRAQVNATDSDDNDPWERISVAAGISIFDPEKDKCTSDVLRRADEQMYEEKKRMKYNNSKDA